MSKGENHTITWIKTPLSKFGFKCIMNKHVNIPLETLAVIVAVSISIQSGQAIVLGAEI
ncbi:MAG: hypothetical protein V3T67_05830 [Nitrosopumilaceae archaeon]